MKRNIGFGSVVKLARVMSVIAVTSSLVTAQETRAARDARPDPSTVQSKDGTSIAYEKSGKGPQLILVGSALASRADAAPLASLLAQSFAVVNYDRRGRGDSADAKTYAVAREIEDIVALVDQCGGSANLFGSSSGAVLALEAANALGAKIVAQVLFEPPFIVDASRPPIPADFTKRITEMLAADRRDETVSVFMVEAVGVPEAMVGTMKKAPMWAKMEKLAHTLPYDLAILDGLQSGKALPANRWKSVAARTLVVDGEKSDAFLRLAAQKLAEVLPASKRRTLEGQDHSAPYMAPQALVPVLVEFLAAQPATRKD
jgi:pimeloyl-ACP methyl ester carboxylesterase